jgi:hypothetical protein
MEPNVGNSGSHYFLFCFVFGFDSSCVVFPTISYVGNFKDLTLHFQDTISWTGITRVGNVMRVLLIGSEFWNPVLLSMILPRSWSLLRALSSLLAGWALEILPS